MDIRYLITPGLDIENINLKVSKCLQGNLNTVTLSDIDDLQRSRFVAINVGSLSF